MLLCFSFCLQRRRAWPSPWWGRDSLADSHRHSMSQQKEHQGWLTDRRLGGSGLGLLQEMPGHLGSAKGQCGGPALWVCSDFVLLTTQPPGQVPGPKSTDLHRTEGSCGVCLVYLGSVVLQKPVSEIHWVQPAPGQRLPQAGAMSSLAVTSTRQVERLLMRSPE